MKLPAASSGTDETSGALDAPGCSKLPAAGGGTAISAEVCTVFALSCRCVVVISQWFGHTHSITLVSGFSCSHKWPGV